MEIFPAIDLSEAQVVRLTQGDYNRKEIYSKNPIEVAQSFQKQGARNLHVVDLDGAKDGAASNEEIIRDIVQKSDLSVQVGGGIRDEKRIYAYLEAGIERVILGTAAAQDQNFVADMVKKYGGRIAVGVDAREGFVAINGWKETTKLDSISFCKTLAEMGVQTIIYTDISRDGMMLGTNLEIYTKLMQQVSCKIIASGGVSAMADIDGLLATKVWGAIIGKALYLGEIDLQEVLLKC